jgi:acyl-coenzyme A synthetase/AMP-(fatty) acid ligase
MLAGAVVTAEALRICISELGSKGVENLFGITEGFWIRSGNQTDPSSLIDGDEVSVGGAQAGLGLKIADVDTNETLPRNTLGELQATGAINRNYIGGVSSENFYVDKKDGRHWFKSGDQARMDENGRIFVTGRYKDL